MEYFKYRYRTNIDFSIKLKSNVSIIGNSNDFFVSTFLEYNKDTNIFIGGEELKDNNFASIYKNVSIVLYKHLNIFVGETVFDEIVFGLESLSYSKDDIIELVQSESRVFKLDKLLEKDPNSLGRSDIVKMKILSSLITKPRVLILDNVISELDYSDKVLVFKILSEYTKNGGIVINATSDIEDTINSDRIIILQDNKLVCDGKTISVLNEEKLLKRLGLGIPFIVELNKYFMDYGMIDKYYLTNEKLVGALWK